ncbi:helix-hairpin-helix domain-containing protein [Mucilaginibacter myungsuensis]|uniref:Pathogenicity locus n=1 Tax=Mucilaginibacter myungsuensis TaxID=649104 RepID=A0A929PY63_9SPHI|nr:helix-hairpin-helix domain-containing protein [Mucilaginibacter myungsuensis]MBE9663125.1 Pathogenicity locus [Mucilaginibacter myungsuensis]MDN3598760.1 helix-hairpin-helix domain-containing protein [Mucilaginibacter myungsuensis]
MKKNIDLELTSAEKQQLRERKVSLKALRDHAPDEIAAMINASAERTKELFALIEFQSIPSLGLGFAKELIVQGYYALDQLKGKSAVELFDAYEMHCGCWADPCVEDSYRLLVHYIEHRDESKRWWDFTKDRKAYRAEFGFPADRPVVAWYETGKYPKADAYMKG